VLRAPEDVAAVTAYGPRASIKRVGVCEQLPDGTWYITGFQFDPRGDRKLIWPCPFMHNDDHEHVGFLGWTWEELKAVSDAQQELAGLETTDSAS
jgi:hypothetical protein